MTLTSCGVIVLSLTASMTLGLKMPSSPATRDILLGSARGAVLTVLLVTNGSCLCGRGILTSPPSVPPYLGTLLGVSLPPPPGLESNMKVIKKLLGSRKFVVALVGSLAAVGASFGLPAEAAQQVATTIVILAGVYIGAQGMADFGKEKKEG